MPVQYEFNYVTRNAANGVLDALKDEQKDGWECINIVHRQGAIWK